MIDEKKLIESSTWYPNILFKEELTWKDGWNNCNRDWMKRIDELPKVILPDTTITGWIPCSERLPEESGNYLISGTWGSGKKSVCDCDFSVEDGYFRTAWNFNTEAWMPLPEAYKGETE